MCNQLHFVTKLHQIFVAVSQQKSSQFSQHDTDASSQDHDAIIQNHTERAGPSCMNESSLSADNTIPPTAPKDYSLATVDEAISKLQERLMWAVNQVGKANSVEMDIKLCELVSSCGNALRTLKDLQH
jgi:hypothetical protein